MTTASHRSGLGAIDVVILAGGLGTRLSAVLPDAPKVLAPVAGRPFLEHVLGWLSEQGARRVILALGSKAGAVLSYLKTQRFGALEIVPMVEPEPLGTAGAVGHVFQAIRNFPVMVMNGDTLVEADLEAFVASHVKTGARASILCACTSDAQRYGSVVIHKSGCVERFEEKKPGAASPSQMNGGWVNAGVYLFERGFAEDIAQLRRGSLERDVLQRMPALSLHAFTTSGRFLDIGTPESLAGAAAFLENGAAGAGRLAG